MSVSAKGAADSSLGQRPRVSFSAKGALSLLAWGNAPGIRLSPDNLSAESAIHFGHQLDHHWRHAPVAQYPESFRDTSSLARRIASLGSIQVCDYACTRIWQQSAATWASTSCR